MSLYNRFFPVMMSLYNILLRFPVRWRAKVILLRIPVRDRPEVQLKAVAYGALEQRRSNWGYNRKWSGSYLNMPVRTPVVIATRQWYMCMLPWQLYDICPLQQSFFL